MTEKVPSVTRRLLAATQLLALLLGFAAASACGEDVKPQEGSETHFLSACSETCGSAAECLCGVCSRVCSDSAQCHPLGKGAACVSLGPRVAEGRCEASETSAMCDLACLATADCSALGASFVCQKGYCRDATPAPIAPGVCESAVIAGDEVVVLGDALIEYSRFTAELEREAVEAGLLAPGDQVRSYASSLYSILASGPLAIANQYETARGEGSARVIVMDGGETDVLNVPCGSAPTADCPAVLAAARGAEALLAQFAGDGVEHVVYFFYADPVGNAGVKAGLDVLRPFVENACGRAALPCHFIDLRPVFAGHPEFAAADGLVFSDSGASATAAAVLDVMLDRCVTN